MYYVSKPGLHSFYAGFFTVGILELAGDKQVHWQANLFWMKKATSSWKWFIKLATTTNFNSDVLLLLE